MFGNTKLYDYEEYDNRESIISESQPVNMWEYRIDRMAEDSVQKSMAKYEDRLSYVEQEMNKLLHSSREERVRQSMGVRRERANLNVAIEKAESVLEEMSDIEDIREQIQHVTRLINQIDLIRKNKVLSADQRKAVVLFRNVLKWNCDTAVFNSEQIEVLRSALISLNGKDSGEDCDFVILERKLREKGFRTMISWE